MDQILKELREIRRLLSLSKRIITLEEFCLYASISKNYAYQLTADNRIKFYRPFGKKIYFEIDDIIDFLKQNGADTAKQRKENANRRFLK